LPLTRVILTVAVDEFDAPTPLSPPTEVPVISICPVDELSQPNAVALEPPVTIPVIFTIPVPLFLTPTEDAAAPPVTLPIIVVVPVEVFPTPWLLAEPPATILPVIVKIPDPELLTACQFPPGFPACIFPTIAPVAALNDIV
jgi:hypothetical protein